MNANENQSSVFRSIEDCARGTESESDIAGQWMAFVRVRKRHDLAALQVLFDRYRGISGPAD